MDLVVVVVVDGNECLYGLLKRTFNAYIAFHDGSFHLKRRYPPQPKLFFMTPQDTYISTDMITSSSRHKIRKVHFLITCLDSQIPSPNANANDSTKEKIPCVRGVRVAKCFYLCSFPVIIMSEFQVRVHSQCLSLIRVQTMINHQEEEEMRAAKSPNKEEKNLP